MPPESNKLRPLTPQVVGILLSQIIGRTVNTKKIPPYPLTAKSPGVVAAYEGDNGSLVSVCVCDLPLASYAGAALVLAPVGLAKDAIRSGACDAVLLENLAEILNICRQWFQQPGEHIASPKLFPVPGALPANIAERLVSKSRLDLAVSIPGYGDGQLSILT